MFLFHPISHFSIIPNTFSLCVRNYKPHSHASFPDTFSHCTYPRWQIYTDHPEKKCY
jgi:hypothetical protein